MGIASSRPHNPTLRQTNIYIINVYEATGRLPIHLEKCRLCKKEATELVNTAREPRKIILKSYCKECLYKDYTLGQIKDMKIYKRKES